METTDVADRLWQAKGAASVQIAMMSVAGSEDRDNEDFVGASPVTAVVLDGLSAPAQLGTGCLHTTSWYASMLGSRLVEAATTQPQTELASIAAAAIKWVASMHQDTCDLTHPGTPAASIAMVRKGQDWLDYLVLFDSVIVIDSDDGGIQTITDLRVESFAQEEHFATQQVPIGTREHHQAVSALVATQRQFRNEPGGYWVAGAISSAASEAITGRVALPAVRSVAVLSDGASCLVDSYERQSWSSLMEILRTAGPSEVIRQVRDAEAADPQGITWPRYKASDDASIAFLRLR